MNEEFDLENVFDLHQHMTIPDLLILYILVSILWLYERISCLLKKKRQ